MGKLCVGRMVLGMVETNCYFVYDSNDKKAIVIDPAKGGSAIREKLSENGIKVAAILLTHGHFDHIMGVNSLKAETECKLYALSEELPLCESSELNASEQIHHPYTVMPDVLLHDGDEIDIEGLNFKVIATPGHTAGSCCYYFKKDKVMFTGDTLFYGSIGRTDLPTGNDKAIIDSIHKLMDMAPDDVKIYPGHGDASTIGWERSNNPFCA